MLGGLFELVSRVETSVGEVHIQAVSVEDTWARLKGDAGSVLIDVRTIAEWAYVGLPDLAQIGKRPVLVEWQGFPVDQQNSTFIERVVEALNPLGANRETELFFICRSGARSQGSPGNGGGRLYALPQRSGRVRGSPRYRTS